MLNIEQQVTFASPCTKSKKGELIGTTPYEMDDAVCVLLNRVKIRRQLARKKKNEKAVQAIK
jgi:hypothetical protein